MTYRTVVSMAAAAILGIACVSTDAMAFRGGGRAGARVGYHGGYHGRGWHGGYAHRGWGVGVGAAAVGAAAVGAAAAAPYYYDSVRCGYYPYQACR